MSVNIKFDPSSGSQNQTVKVSGNCNPGIDETIQFQVQTEDGSKTEIINVTQEGKREVLMVSDGQGGYTEFMPSDGGTFNVVKEEWKENPDCGPANGVYVYTVDGQLVKPEEWDTANNDQAAGVAVIDTNCQFAISKSLPVNNMMWSNELYNVDVIGLPNCNSLQAKTDYSGMHNTYIIVSQSNEESSSYNSSVYCQEQTLNGMNGYLPSVGELLVMGEKKYEIDETLVAIGSKTITDRLGEFGYYDGRLLWSSTEGSDETNMYCWSLYWDSPEPFLQSSVKGSSNKSFAFPFFPLTETGGGY